MYIGVNPEINERKKSVQEQIQVYITIKMKNPQ